MRLFYKGTNRIKEHNCTKMYNRSKYHSKDAITTLRVLDKNIRGIKRATTVPKKYIRDALE